MKMEQFYQNNQVTPITAAKDCFQQLLGSIPQCFVARRTTVAMADTFSIDTASGNLQSILSFILVQTRIYAQLLVLADIWNVSPARKCVYLT